MVRKITNEQRKIVTEAINIIREKFVVSLRENKPLLGYGQLYDKIYKQIEAKIKLQLNYKEIEPPKDEEPVPKLASTQSVIV